MDLDIKVKDFKKQDFIVVGDLSLNDNVDDVRNDLINRIQKYNLFDISGKFTFSFYMRNENSDYRYSEVMVPSNQSSTSSFNIVRERDQKIVSGVYKGPYDDFRSVHQKVRDYIHANDMEVSHFPLEFYLNNSLKVPKEELLLNVQIPVIDFKTDHSISVESIETKKIKPRKIAFIQHNGPMQEMSIIKNKLKNWVLDNEIDYEEYYLKFVTHPDGVHSSENVFEVGVFIDPTEKIEESNDVKIVDVPSHEDIIATYKGPLPIEVYLNDPLKEKPENLLTEIRAPAFHYEFDRDIELKSLTTKYVRNPEYVMIRHRGSLEEIANVRYRMNEWCRENSIPVCNSYFIRYCKNPLGIFPENMFFDVGFLTKKSNKNNHVRVVEFPQHEFLSAIHKGPYENLKEVITTLREYAAKKGINLADFHREKYFNQIPPTKKEELLTEVQIPLKIR